LLDTTVEEALPLLENIPQINQKLQTLARRRTWLHQAGPVSRRLFRRRGATYQARERALETRHRQDDLHPRRTHHRACTSPTFINCSTSCNASSRWQYRARYRAQPRRDQIADYIIDLGPEGGEHGGRVVAAGTPEEVARSRRSHTGHVLRPLLNGHVNGVQQLATKMHKNT
jgi:excinuclease ABC subunit A